MINRRYDYIILGAGTSGCYLAAELSKNKSIKVLLVDAGPLSKNPIFAMPAGFTQTLFDKNYNWCFNSMPEEQLDHRSIYCPRGKVVGGSSMINGMIHSIGQVEDYQNWVEAGFSLATPEGVMSQFSSLFPRDDAISKAENHPLESAFLSACDEAGFNRSEVFHESHSQQASGVYYHTIRDGRRASVRKLIPELSKRSNVTLLANTYVDKLSIDSGSVNSIRLLKKGRKTVTVDVPTSTEVILSLGAIGSPSALQRSGVGRLETVTSLGIDLYADLPVGENLQDHLLVKRTYKLNDMQSYNSDAAPTALPKTLWDYTVNRKGAMAVGASSVGLYASSNDDCRPDTQIFMAYGSATESRKALVADGFDAITIGAYQMRPESRGTVTISSKDPMSSPNIHYNYLSTENDWQVTRFGLSLVESLMEKQAFSPYQPSAIKTEVDEEYIRQFAETAHHPVGTCALGENGVLDGDLKVKGFSNLRVADASVIPHIISGNTQAVCAVIGNLLAKSLLSGVNYV